jgi:hypothetical protein
MEACNYACQSEFYVQLHMGRISPAGADFVTTGPKPVLEPMVPYHGIFLLGSKQQEGSGFDSQ